jgi:phage recombination protein Bet
MSVQLVTDNTPDLFSDARVKLIKQQVAPDAPDHLFKAMIEIARVRGLDPLAKQISLIKFGNQWQVTTTIDGYRALAEQTGAYAGSDAAVFVEDNNKIISATVTVWKMVDHQRVPFSATVYWAEYNADNFTWKKMPRTMIAKVAESHALRKAFPSTLSGMYTTDEMAQAGPKQGFADSIPSDMSDASQDTARGFSAHLAEVVDDDTGEITRPLSEAIDDEQKRRTALASVFTIGTDRGLAQDDIKKIAYARYHVTSMTKLTIANLRDYWKFLNNEDIEGLQHELFQASQTTTDAEYTELPS